MGSFWGLDNAGKEAQGWPRQYGADTSQQYKDWVARQNQAYSTGDAKGNWAADYQQARAANGIGTIADANAAGSMIMPGVQQYITDKSGRIQSQIDAFKQLPSAADTMKTINQATSDKGQLIRDTRDYNLNDIADTFHRANATEGAAHDYNTSDLTDRYNKLIADTHATYGGLESSANDTWDKALANTELLKPASQFAQAQAARSFAGQAGQAGGGLRRMGIDPNSPQGLAVMQRVATGRSRAMDDAAAAGTAAYVNANTAALTGKQADAEKLRQAELTGTTGLSVDQGAGLRGESVRNAGALQAMDAARSGQVIGQQNKTLGQASDYEDELASNAIKGKALATQDWQTQGALQGQLSDAQLEAIGLTREQYNAGMGYQTQNLAEKNAGAAAVGAYGQQQTGNSLAMANTALNYGNAAEGAYQTAYGYEAPQAGYGVKMLAAAAGPALNAVAPGLGTAVTTAAAPGVSAATPGAQPGGYSNAPGVAPSAQTPGFNGTTPVTPQRSTDPYGYSTLWNTISGWGKKPASGADPSATGAWGG